MKPKLLNLMFCPVKKCFNFPVRESETSGEKEVKHRAAFNGEKAEREREDKSRMIVEKGWASHPCSTPQFTCLLTHLPVP